MRTTKIRSPVLRRGRFREPSVSISVKVKADRFELVARRGLNTYAKELEGLIDGANCRRPVGTKYQFTIPKYGGTLSTQSAEIFSFKIHQWPSVR